MPLYQLILIGVAAIAVVGLITFSVFNTTQQQKQYFGRLNIQIKTTPTEVVLAEESTPTPDKAKVVVSGSPTPLWMKLKATYTPTAIYVNTPHPSQENFRIALKNYQKGDWAAAISNFQVVLSYDPNQVDVIYFMGEAYRQQGNLADALDNFNKVIKMSPNFAPPYVGRARVTLAKNPKAFKEAQADMQLAINKDPNYGEAYLAMASLQLQQKQPQRALDTLEFAAQLMPDSPLVYLSRAEANLALDKNNEALADARKANELDITLLEPYRMIGEALVAKGDIQGAFEYLNTYVTYETKDPLAWVWMAKAYMANQDTENALKAITKALNLNNYQLDAHLLRGNILLGQKKYDLALADFETAENIDSESYDAVMGKGFALMGLDTRGATGDAYGQFEAAKPLAETDHQNAERIYWLAMCLEKLGENKAAVNYWQALLQLPKGAVDASWATYAQQRLAVLITSTPTTPPKTATPTITLTNTRVPTKTLTPTSTRQPTRTQTPAPTKPPTRTATPTPTRKP